ncbi:30S ribosomal protein S3Ae [Candidatus Gugararchaeum adminiculabundum]|nr:30S ribosomal protein S3Ae [Candidatus Gugararchaeum adminiculabundum]
MAAPRRAVDKWKMKKWYNVVAPELFEKKTIGEIISIEDENLLNRKVKASMADLTGDMGQVYTMITFRVTDVKGESANTKIVGHELSRSYLRTLVRRRKNIIRQVQDVKTKDNATVRLKISALTQTRVSDVVKQALRRALVDEIAVATKDMNYEEIERDVIYGKLSAKLFNKLKKIAPVKRVEVHKSELLEQFN